jgi:hypothetical protein
MTENGLILVPSRMQRSELERVTGVRTDRVPGATIHRLHRASCRHAHGPLATPISLEQWDFQSAHATPGDEWLLCKVCRPEEGDPRP